MDTPGRRPQRRAAAARVRAWERRFTSAVLALGRSARGPAGFGRARGILHVFRLAEWLTMRGRQLRPVRPGGLVLYEVMRLPGRPLPLPGQPPVRRGELVIGLHFDNRVIAALAVASPDARTLTWRMIQTGREDLRILADLARNGAFPPGVRVLWGETLFYLALARFGFATRPTPRSLRTPFVRLFMLGLIAIYGSAGAVRPDRRQDRPLTLGEAWMSLDDLQRRFPLKAKRESL